MDTYIDGVYPSLYHLTPTLVDDPSPSLELAAPTSPPLGRGIKSKDKV
jgi:hypothetical protein